MSTYLLQSLDQPAVPARPISDRLRSQLAYFAAPAGVPGLPAPGEHEYILPAAEIARALDEGVIYLISPLDTANMTEVEISEEQEALLQWLQQHGVQHVRVIDRS